MTPIANRAADLPVGYKKDNKVTDNEPKDYSFILSPNQKLRHIAGTFDYDKKQPHYEIDISVPQHVRNQVEVNQIIVGSPENCQWGWDLSNKSTWPAFVTIKCDGVIMKLS